MIPTDASVGQGTQRRAAVGSFIAWGIRAAAGMHADTDTHRQKGRQPNSQSLPPELCDALGF